MDKQTEHAGTSAPQAPPREYEAPDIGWEEDLPPIALGLSCAHRPGQSFACEGKPEA